MNSSGPININYIYVSTYFAQVRPQSVGRLQASGSPTPANLPSVGLWTSSLLLGCPCLAEVDSPASGLLSDLYFISVNNSAFSFFTKSKGFLKLREVIVGQQMILDLTCYAKCKNDMLCYEKCAYKRCSKRGYIFKIMTQLTLSQSLRQNYPHFSLNLM